MGGVNVGLSLWEGVYWDDAGLERACILVMMGDRVLSAIDAETKDPLLDPASAIPVQPMPNK